MSITEITTLINYTKKFFEKMTNADYFREVLNQKKIIENYIPWSNNELELFKLQDEIQRLNNLMFVFSKKNGRNRAKTIEVTIESESNFYNEKKLQEITLKLKNYIQKKNKTNQ